MARDRLKTSPQSPCRRRGIALVLVICVMAMAAILSYAVLASSSLQAAAGTNSLAAAIADGQAESGVQLATYYLLNPANAPSLTTYNGLSYWPGANNITFSTTSAPTTTMGGSVSVSVTPVSGSGNTWYFQVVSTGSSGGSVSVSVTRTMTATVQVATGYVISQAATLNSSLSVTALSTITGSPTAILSGSTVQILGTVNGNVSAASLLPPLSGILNGTLLPGPSMTTPAPTTSNVLQLNSSHQYSYNGSLYTATQITGGSIAASTTLGANSSNPLGVYWSSGSLTVNKNVTINGSLINTGGNVTVVGTNVNITAVTPATGAAAMPAVMSYGKLIMSGTTAKLTATGVVFAEQGVTGSGSTLGASLIINGAFLADSGSISGYLGSVSINFNSSSALVSIPNLSTANQTPQSVKVVSWSQ